MSGVLSVVLVLLLFLGLAAAWVGAWVFRRRTARPTRRPGGSEQPSWVFDGGLRLVSGEQPGLSRRWRHGRVTIQPGSLTLRAARLGLRILLAPPVTVGVTAIDHAAEQEAGLASMLSVRPGSRLVAVTTTTGATVQLAVLSSQTQEAFAALVSRPATI